MSDSNHTKAATAGLFGGALFAAGIAATTITATDANAQCSPEIGGTILADNYELGAPYGAYSGYQHGIFSKFSISDDRLYAVVKNFAYFGGNYVYRDNLLTFDISDVTSPQLIGSWLASPSIVSEFSGSVPLVAIGSVLVHKEPNSNNIRFYSLADPNNAILASSISTPATSSEFSLRAANGLIYAAGRTADGEQELSIIDPSDPFSPVLLGSLTIPDMGFNGNMGFPSADLVCVVGGNFEDPARLVVIDISDPTNPIVLSETIPPVFAANGGWIVEQTWLTKRGSLPTVDAFDLSDPSAPIPLPTVTTAGGRSVPFDELLITENGPLFDFTDPSAPVNVATLPFATILPSVGPSFDQTGSTIATLSSNLEVLTCIDLAPCLLPKVLSVSPGGITDEGGAPVMITATESGAGSFQWLKDGVPVADGPRYTGATTDSLTIAADLGAVGVYSIELTNDIGSTTGGEALVGVRPDTNPCLSDLNGDNILDLTDINIFTSSFVEGCN